MPRRTHPHRRRTPGYTPGVPSQRPKALTYEGMAARLVLAGLASPNILDHPARIVGNLRAVGQAKQQENR